MRPNFCSCPAGWDGPATGCLTRMLTERRERKGEREREDTKDTHIQEGIRHTDRRKKLNIFLAICTLGCNGGSCVSPGSCSCLAGWDGPTTGCTTRMLLSPSFSFFLSPSAFLFNLPLHGIVSLLTLPHSCVCGWMQWRIVCIAGTVLMSCRVGRHHYRMPYSYASIFFSFYFPLPLLI